MILPPPPPLLVMTKLLTLSAFLVELVVALRINTVAIITTGFVTVLLVAHVSGLEMVALMLFVMITMTAMQMMLPTIGAIIQGLLPLELAQLVALVSRLSLGLVVTCSGGEGYYIIG
jgi:hypothetical protein